MPAKHFPTKCLSVQQVKFGQTVDTLNLIVQTSLRDALWRNLTQIGREEMQRKTLELYQKLTLTLEVEERLPTNGISPLTVRRKGVKEELFTMTMGSAEICIIEVRHCVLRR